MTCLDKVAPSRGGSDTAVAVLVTGLLGAGAVRADAAPNRAGSTVTADAPFAVGISPGSDVLWERPSQVASTMSAIAATGDKWIRIDLDWAAVEATNGTYNWNAEDTAIGDAVKAGLTVDAILDYAPSWAVVNGQPSASAFASFATQATHRYARQGVNVYEIWNEENLGWTWNNSVDATSYGQLLKSGYKAVHSADSHAVVLLGGLGRGPDLTNGESVDPYHFLSELYAGGFGRYFDAVNVHPYSAPDAPLTNDPATNEFIELPAFYSLMQANGDGAKKIWVTEYGYPTANDRDTVTEQQQADYLTTAIESIMSQSWAGPFLIYNWQDDTTQWYGLTRIDGSPKPALAVFEESPH